MPEEDYYTELKKIIIPFSEFFPKKDKTEISEEEKAEIRKAIRNQGLGL